MTSCDVTEAQPQPVTCFTETALPSFSVHLQSASVWSNKAEPAGGAGCALYNLHPSVK